MDPSLTLCFDHRSVRLQPGQTLRRELRKDATPMERRDFPVPLEEAMLACPDCKIVFLPSTGYIDRDDSGQLKEFKPGHWCIHDREPLAMFLTANTTAVNRQPVWACQSPGCEITHQTVFDHRVTTPEMQRLLGPK